MIHGFLAARNSMNMRSTMTFGVLGTIVTDIIVLVALGSFGLDRFSPAAS